MAMQDSEPQGQPPGPVRVLVVDPDPMFGLLVEACLGFEGAVVISASTLADAVGHVDVGLGGLVVEPALADGDGLDLLRLVEQRCPEIPVVVCVDASIEQGPRPVHWPGARVSWVDKGDLARMVQVLGLGDEPDHLPEDHLLHISALDLDSI